MLTRSFKNICGEILEQGKRYLDMHTGVVAQLLPNRILLVAVASNTNVFVQGDVYRIENTICSHVVRNKKTLAIHDIAAARETGQHPLYIPSTLRAYIGAPVILDGEVWGILDFTSFTAKPHPFQADQIRFIEEYAAGLSDILHLYAPH